MAIRKSNHQKSKSAQIPARLSREALDDVSYELGIAKSVLYVGVKAFNVPDFKPSDDLGRNAYSTLVVVQDRLAALMERLEIPFREGLRAVERIDPGFGIRSELVKLHEMIDLLMVRTGMIGCPEAPSILQVLYAETCSICEYTEYLIKEAA